ncbi:hypothetical protein HPB48_022219 [Haemaphysalis longicornis]|uniref:CCHC-type domain-containing protein n=1 Tax=Haemaphysalis longicornis TaxID=44386 RepID=A0A9J6GU59_HAELO|nr:hypothetical protein HPB48_022219 [Haemaphysalis longicornis]
MQLLTAPPGFNIVAARMVGDSTTAIITFEGTYIPLSVSLGGAIHRCKPHCPKAQICFKCLGLGHRADVCTRATTARCPNCGYANKGEAHTCITKCVNCQGPRRSDDASCSKNSKPTQWCGNRPTSRGSTYVSMPLNRHLEANNSFLRSPSSQLKARQPNNKQALSNLIKVNRLPENDNPARMPTPTRSNNSTRDLTTINSNSPKKVSQPLSYKQANRTYREALTPHLNIPKAPIYNAQVYQQHIGTAPPPLQTYSSQTTFLWKRATRRTTAANPKTNAAKPMKQPLVSR